MIPFVFRTDQPAGSGTPDSWPTCHRSAEQLRFAFRKLPPVANWDSPGRQLLLATSGAAAPAGRFLRSILHVRFQSLGPLRFTVVVSPFLARPFLACHSGQNPKVLCLEMPT